MLVRLAFATAIQVDAEILLIDEVLAVGDAAFQQKCFEEFFRLKREGKTIVFVSHDMDSIERFCDRAMLMEHGVDAADRRPARSPAPTTSSTSASCRTARPRPARRATGTAIVDAWFENAAGERIVTAAQEEPLRMCFEVRFAEELEDPVFAATLRTELGHTIIVARSDERGAGSGSFRAGERRGRALRDAELADRQPLPADALDRARGHRRGRRRARRGHGLVIVIHGSRERRHPRAAAEDGDRALMSARHRRGLGAAGRRAQPPGSRALRPERRPAPLLVADLHARADRIQAALLRLGARLPVDARAPAAAVRRDLGVLHEDRARQRLQPARHGAATASQLLGSIVLFTFFAEATGGAVRSIVDRENLLRKIHFPRLVIPLRSCCSRCSTSA